MACKATARLYVGIQCNISYVKKPESKPRKGKLIGDEVYQ
jgi:hypothetical protein